LAGAARIRKDIGCHQRLAHPGREPGFEFMSISQPDRDLKSIGRGAERRVKRTIAWLVTGRGYVKKLTPGITESSEARAHIDPPACYLDVGSS